MSIRTLDCSGNNLNEVIKCYNDDPETYCKINIDKKIGEGSYGSIYEAKFNNEEIAVKIQSYEKGNDTEKENLTNEILMTEYLRSLDLDYVVKVYGYSWINTDKYVYGLIFMEKLKSQLSNYLIENDNNAQTVKDILFRAIEILSKLHECKIFHSDSHIGNFMFNCENKLKIIDYGFTIIDKLKLNAIKNKLGLEYTIPNRVDYILIRLSERIPTIEVRKKTHGYEASRKRIDNISVNNPDYKTELEKKYKEVIYNILEKFDYYLFYASIENNSLNQNSSNFNNELDKAIINEIQSKYKYSKLNNYNLELSTKILFNLVHDIYKIFFNFSELTEIGRITNLRRRRFEKLFKEELINLLKPSK